MGPSVCREGGCGPAGENLWRPFGAWLGGLALCSALAAAACGDGAIEPGAVNHPPRVTYDGLDPFVVNDDSLVTMDYHVTDEDGNLDLFQLVVEAERPQYVRMDLSGGEAFPRPRINPPGQGTYLVIAVVHDAGGLFARDTTTLVVK